MLGRCNFQFIFAGFAFDPETGELVQSNLTVRINRQVADLLLILLQHAGQLVTREQIKDVLWPDRYLLNHDKVITNGISRLRFLLNDSAAQSRYIESIPKRGYRLIVEVRQVEVSSLRLLQGTRSMFAQDVTLPALQTE